MTDMNTSVPEVAEEDDLESQLAAMREAERDEGGEQPEDVTDGEQSEAQETGAETGQGDKPEDREPLSADEWKQRHDNLQKALHAERSKRKENDEYRQKFAEIETRLSQLTPQERKEAKEEADKRPDATKDPLAALDYALNKIEQYERVENERVQQTEQQRKQQEQIAEIQTFGAQSEQAFREQAPDYDDAAQHYAASRVDELQGVYGLSPQEAQQQLSTELMVAVARSRQSGQNPAEAIYKAAKARGWQAKAKDDAATDQKRDDSGRYQKMKDGQKASKTLSGPGSKVKAEATLESLIDMDDDPLEALHKGEESEFDRKFSAYARGARRA